MVDIGDPAPNVILKTGNGSELNKDFELASAYEKGTVVLYFFPLAFTGTCTESNCNIRDDMEEFAQLDAHIYSISVDSPFVLNEFAKVNNLTYPILSDFNREASAAFGAQYEELGGLRKVAKRSLFVVKNGKVTYKWITDVAGDYPPFDELKEHLKTLKET